MKSTRSGILVLLWLTLQLGSAQQGCSPWIGNTPITSDTLLIFKSTFYNIWLNYANYNPGQDVLAFKPTPSLFTLQNILNFSYQSNVGYKGDLIGPSGAIFGTTFSGNFVATGGNWRNFAFAKVPTAPCIDLINEEPGQDRPGDDYKTMAVSLSACKSACCAEARCMAYTWVSSNPNTGFGGTCAVGGNCCWLKERVGTQSSSSICTSGVKQIPIVRLYGSPIAGNDIAHFGVFYFQNWNYLLDKNKAVDEFQVYTCPYCANSCGNGYCSSPGVCTCNAGWIGSNCGTPICNTGCQRGATCTSPNTCSCPTIGGVTTYFNYYCDVPYKALAKGESYNVGDYSSGFTVSAIIKLTSSSSTGRIFDKITAGTSDGWLLDSLYGRYRVIIGSYIFWGNNIAPDIPYNQYQFVTITYNSNYISLFINGQWANSYYAPGVASNSLLWRVGVASDGSNVFQGTIERARFYWAFFSDTSVREDFYRAQAQYPNYTFAPMFFPRV